MFSNCQEVKSGKSVEIYRVKFMTIDVAKFIFHKNVDVMIWNEIIKFHVANLLLLE